MAMMRTLPRQRASGSSSAKLWLEPVPAENLATYLPTCLPVLQRALDKTDEIDAASLVALLHDGSAQLLVEFLEGEPQGVAVTMIINYPLFAALEVLLIAGFPDKTQRYPNADSFDLLKQWARILGCKRIQGFTNEAVARLWQRIGFKEISRKMGIDL